MLNLVFFARVKEQLGCSDMKLDWDGSLATLEALKFHLGGLHGETWIRVLAEDNLVCAVNQTVVEDDHVLTNGDEVAFFPPVTGG
ncbi:MAG: molybdopterin synthase sulfur carrier subunit [Halioglobus sp.]|jgi:molybdopterin synthase sulfur carrier subunit